MSDRELKIADADAMEALGGRLAACCEEGVTIFLQGDLGAGKTTLVRGFLRALGHRGAVRSPTYTLVEPYEAGPCPIYHFDLYRLGDPEELEYLGARDYFGGGICLVEWPERGTGWLPPPDFTIRIAYGAAETRAVTLYAGSAAGERVLACLEPA